MNMEPTMSSETSAIRTQAPGNYPNRNKLRTKNYFIIQTQIIRCVAGPSQTSATINVCFLCVFFLIGAIPLCTSKYMYITV